MKIYTKKGDYGETSLCNGAKTSKDSYRIKAYGTVDELTAFIGLSIVKIKNEKILEHLQIIIDELQAISANLAYPADLSQSIIGGNSFADNIPKIAVSDIERVEKWIDEYEKELPELTHFISYFNTEAGSLLNVARTICRRAERRIVALKHHEEVSKNVLKYVNRISDYFFVASRLINYKLKGKEVQWKPNK
ncbi:cob(I)yrinic acid a,c-diamide adenosyltransferase [archaeon]|jgi:cob(I)alamin adenosyltransferase|nr:cob(I)yrinic acid a,c-diamide adenosyltransferase [archaeon]MBT4351528.1 cob(I)yrinic acid a,c-diamide adenosyltransferase [archaeon]MBT4646644.1 cob(I)yrinic acid a,c-diamide adenosyltransferase [archaeon]MBT6821907.1 cob(I)yrinic acid a,c-diamide adenosyltransferase [archaeon]MBT7392316.1 cob(I)yrinic acid a,c-diamide adenosyltransferase [archaeon]